MGRAANVKVVLEAVQKLYPKQLADSKWDNTGLLVDATFDDAGSKPETKSAPRVLLTIDLTRSVCDEAIEQNSDIVIAYHPFIFSGIKAISSENPQHQSLIRLLRSGISVYSPHTAVDASTRGVNDWLADCVTFHGENEAKRSTLELVSPPVPGHENAGYGRLISLRTPVPLDDIVKRVKSELWMSTVQLVRAEKHKKEPISTIALCAGSGGSVLSRVKADLWFTGELGHHQMLFLKESGTSAIVCGHSNTERGYLPIMRELLKNELKSLGEVAVINLAATDTDPIQYV